MKRVALGLLGLSLSAVPAVGQVAAIQTRRVMSLGDDDGPGSIATAAGVFAKMSDGRIILAPMNELPLVFDRNGKFLKPLGRQGQGPGEFDGYVGLIRVIRGDTLLVHNGRSFSVFSPDLRFVRSMNIGGERFITGYVESGAGSVISRQMPGGMASDPVFNRLGVVDSANRLVRTFAPDSVKNHHWYFTIARSDPEHLWAVESRGRPVPYRIERWSLRGERVSLIDKAPAWWPDAKETNWNPSIADLRQVGNRLWVICQVALPNAGQFLPKGTGELSMKQIPYELMYNSYIQVYDIATGAVVAEQRVPGYVTGFLDDSHFMRYAVDSKDIPRMEVWEMKIKP